MTQNIIYELHRKEGRTMKNSRIAAMMEKEKEMMRNIGDKMAKADKTGPFYSCRFDMTSGFYKDKGLSKPLMESTVKGDFSVSVVKLAAVVLASAIVVGMICSSVERRICRRCEKKDS